MNSLVQLLAAKPAAKLGALAITGLMGLAAVRIAACGSTSPQVLSADNVAIDLTDTVCAPLENQPAGQPWVDMVCTLAEGAEDVIAQIETAADAGLAAAPKVKTIKIRVSPAAAAVLVADAKAKREALAAAKAQKDGGSR